MAILWLCLTALSMTIGLAARPLADPDESRNAEVAREMAAAGDYLMPRFDGLPRADKPFAYYAAVATSFKLFGLSEGAARLISALSTVLTALLVAAFARHMFAPGADILAAAALLVAPLPWIYSQLVILDAFFTLWVVAAILAFYLAVEAVLASAHPRQHRWSLAAWAAIALAILTKGPVGLVVPLLVAMAYALHRRAVRAVFDLPAMILAALLVIPWVWMMSERVPGYLRYVAEVETWQRIATDTLHRSQPFWYFIPILAIGSLPSSILVVAGLRRGWRDRSFRQDPRWVFLILWMTLPLVMFSLSHSKMPHYVLPVVPAFALAAAGFCVERGPVWSRGLRRFDGRSVLVRPIALLTICYFVGQPLFARLAQARSTRELAVQIHHVLPTDGGRVIGVHAFPPGLPFYLGHPVELASPNGRELNSNYLSVTYGRWIHGNTSVHPVEFWQRALATCREPTVFVTRTDDTEARRKLTAAKLRLIEVTASYAIYGPCRPQ